MQFLQWENQQQKMEIQSLRDWIQAQQQQQKDQFQKFETSRAALRHTIGSLEQTVNGLQHELAERSNLVATLSNTLRYKDKLIRDQNVANGVLLQDKQEMSVKLTTAEAVMRNTGVLLEYHLQLDPNAVPPSPLRLMALKRTKTAGNKRLKLENSITKGENKTS